MKRNSAEATKPAAAPSRSSWDSDNVMFAATSPTAAAMIPSSNAIPVAGMAAVSPAMAAVPKAESLYETLVRYHEENDDDDDDDTIIRRRNRKKAAAAASTPWKSSSDTGGESDSSFEDSKPSARPVPDRKMPAAPLTKPTPAYESKHNVHNSAIHGNSHNTHTPREMSSFYRHAMEESKMAPPSPSIPRMDSITADDAAIAAAVASEEGYSMEDFAQKFPESPPQVRPGVVRVNEPVIRPDTAVYRIQTEEEALREQQKKDKKARKEKRRKKKEAAAAAAAANSGLVVARPVVSRPAPVRQIATAVAVPIEQQGRPAKTAVVTSSQPIPGRAPQTAVVTPAQPIVKRSSDTIRRMDNIGVFQSNGSAHHPTSNPSGKMFRRQNNSSSPHNGTSGHNHNHTKVNTNTNISSNSALNISSHDRYDRWTQHEHGSRHGRTVEIPRGATADITRRNPPGADSGVPRGRQTAESSAPTIAPPAPNANVPYKNNNGLLANSQYPSFRTAQNKLQQKQQQQKAAAAAAAAPAASVTSSATSSSSRNNGLSSSSSMNTVIPNAMQHPAVANRVKSDSAKAAYTDYLESPNTLRHKTVDAAAVVAAAHPRGYSRSATTGTYRDDDEDEDEQMRMALELSKQEALIGNGYNSKSKNVSSNANSNINQKDGANVPATEMPKKERLEQMRTDYANSKDVEGSLRDLLLALQLSEEAASSTTTTAATTTATKPTTANKQELGKRSGSTTMEELLQLESTMVDFDSSNTTTKPKLVTDYVAAGISTDPKSRPDDQYIILEQIRLEQERAELEMALLASAEDGDGPADSEEFLRSQLKLMEQFKPKQQHEQQQQLQPNASMIPLAPTRVSIPNNGGGGGGGAGNPSSSPLPLRRRRLSTASQDSNERRRELVQHGTLETQQAISAGFAHTVTCRGCQSRLQAPVSYSLVFCPKCQTISPVG